MVKYHDTGTVCKAVKRVCPLGLSDGDHIEAANEKEFEKKLAERINADTKVPASRGNISRVTDLCEVAMESGANLREVSQQIGGMPDRETLTMTTITEFTVLE